jgi:acetyl-CoA carboxylase biotin carboxylase subunit
VIHFGTRDCSAQRRHQKLVEEAPAPFLDPDVREAIHAAAVKAAQSVGYYNAGTAEFLVLGREFYFLEINTRIQVEHPITEAITGVDLVRLQLRVAMGEPLPLAQKAVSFSGHAIELRINAEDPREGFRPALGTIERWERAHSDSVREDCGYRVGDTIPQFYDSLISKVIVHGASRAEALFNAFEYLRGYSIEGIPTTTPFHVWLLAHPQFQTTGIDIGFVEREFVPAEIDDALSLLWRDPAHRADGNAAVPFSEHVEVEASAGGRRSFEITHERGGTFLAKPLSSTGEPLPQSTWRRSLSREAAISAVSVTE